jgi:dTDP-4-amino-4,6-dideoxygalactose transaminase
MNKWPQFAEDEIKAVENVLRSGKVNYWTGGECNAFEKEFAEYIGAKHAICLSNGTVSIELALIACGVKSGDEVITTPRTFIASASAIVAVGGVPILADVDLKSQNITAESIKEKITAKTKAILPVHIAGWPCEMDKIMALADENDLFVIEDCAQAHGAEYKGKKVGSWGHFGSFSFCQDKIMTTGGEGGLLTCNDEALYKKAWSHKDHGKGYDTVFNTEHPPGFRWLHETFGTNMRMTQMQAAIGRKQLNKLPKWLESRNKHANVLSQEFEKISAIRVEKPNSQVKHAWYKYYAFVRTEKLKEDWSRKKIIAEIKNQGVVCFEGGCSEIYLEKAFCNSPYALQDRLKNAKELGETDMMFLVHPTLSDDDILKTVKVVKNVFEMATA